jgi:hypothetical protein
MQTRKRVREGVFSMLKSFAPVLLALGVVLSGGLFSQEKKDTPPKKKKAPPVIVYESGIAWEEPKPVTPGSNSSPPSDAIVLFDGKNLDAWTGGEKWILEDGFGIAKSRITSKQAFGDCQLHLEFATPPEVNPKQKGQARGNNGVGLMGHYEIQILDSFDNPTYLDGMCASIYKQRPPLVNVARKPGEWQSYDIVFEAPRFQDGKLARAGYVTVLHNGVLVHNHVALLGKTAYDQAPEYRPHGAKEPLVLMYHGNPVRFRNVWIREIKELQGKQAETKAEK